MSETPATYASMSLRIGDDLTLPKDAVTQTFGVLAVRGAGKSNLAAVMAEQMSGAALPFVVIDPVGSWWGLRSNAAGRGPGLSIPIFGGRHGDIPLERTAGNEVADLVVDERASCVLDLAEFSEGDKIRFLIDFAERLYRRNEMPLHLFLEEVDDYIPQRPMREQARLLRAWENIVRRGRARGLGMTMITQRSAAINKNVLTQIETLFVLRTTSPNDRKAIEAWVDYHGERREVLATLPSLANGEAWVWSPNWLRQFKRVKIHRRSTFDSAATPKQSAAGRKPATLADIDLSAVQQRFAATIERAKADDPKALRADVARLQRELAAAQKATPAPAEAVKVPVLEGAELKRAEKLAERLDAIAEKLANLSTVTLEAVATLKAGIARATVAPIVGAGHGQSRSSAAGAALPRHDSLAPAARQRHESAASGPRQRQANVARTGNGSVAPLPVGERLTLTACAQYPTGCAREQLSILTGYKRSTRDAYVQRLREKGYVDTSGALVVATAEGVAALGPDFEPLPTGDALLSYWMDRLPEGERKVLEVLCATGAPRSVDRETIDEATGYKRSTRDAYIQRLNARRLVVNDGRGAVRAAEQLFG